MRIPKIILAGFLTSGLLLQHGCGEAIPQQPGNNDYAAPVAAPEAEPFVPSSGFRDYWYAGVAEVSSFELDQARYGELREGEAVLIFVTEPFNLDKQVKADQAGGETTSVLKLNRVRKFLTGVYPYSIMSSIFYPVSDDGHALKVSTSIQEWCGHVYTQLNTQEDFEITAHSYFEQEADQEVSIPLTLLEDEIWTRLRFRPELLPTGSMHVVPSMEYMRLKHVPIQAYRATLTLSEPAELRTYTLVYPELNRTLEIHFQGSFPYRIEGWTETYPGGFGAGSPTISSTARRKNTLLTSYWRKNANTDVSLRDSLGLSPR